MGWGILPVWSEKGSGVEERLQRLEDIEAIRQLKARYLNACDTKDAQVLLDCFSPDEVDIDYGHVGRFSSREAFVDLFVQAAAFPFVLDMHHGANHEIEFQGPQAATGRWSFDYRNVNTDANTITLASGLYDDVYTKDKGRWTMRASRVTYKSAVHLVYTDASIASVFAGESVAGVVSYGD